MEKLPIHIITISDTSFNKIRINTEESNYFQSAFELLEHFLTVGDFSFEKLINYFIFCNEEKEFLLIHKTQF